MNQPPIDPDTKDWTWVLREPCPECGYDAHEVDRAKVGDRIRANAAEWTSTLARSSAAVRPDPATWSPLEYGCHVRDVHRIFGVRLASMLGEDTPRFANWARRAASAPAAARRCSASFRARRPRSARRRR